MFKQAKILFYCELIIKQIGEGGMEVKKALEESTQGNISISMGKDEKDMTPMT